MYQTMFVLCLLKSDSIEKEEALGMEWGYIHGSQISSSGHTDEHSPSEARLHNVNGFWSAEIQDEIWLQIDFLELFGITGIQTQGASPTIAEWVKTLQIYTGNDVNSITPIMEGRDPMVSNICPYWNCFEVSFKIVTTVPTIRYNANGIDVTSTTHIGFLD